MVKVTCNSESSTHDRDYVIVWPHMDAEGGVQQIVVDMSANLLNMGYSVSVVCDPGSFSNRLDPKVRMCSLKGQNNVAETLHLIKNSPRSDITIIAFNATSAAIMERIGRAARKSGKNVEIVVGAYHPRTFHTDEGNALLSFLTHMMARAIGRRAIYFMNEECRRSHAKLVSAEFGKSNIIILPVSDRTPLWSRPSSDALRIVSVGRITKFKSYNFHARSIIDSLHNFGIDLTWDIYGWGEAESELKDILCGQDRVRFLGKLDAEKFDITVCGYDLFVGMGMSAVQSSQLGVPTILATDSLSNNCIGFSSNAPEGNVGELPGNANLVVPIADVVVSYSNMKEKARLTVSQDCMQWAEQFSYKSFWSALNNHISQSEVRSPFLYRVVSQIFLWSLSIKRNLRYMTSRFS